MRKRNRLESYLATARGQRFINYVYSIGAAVVILGAMFKILHVSGGNILLAVGMITEALVFLISAFDPTMSGEAIEAEGSDFSSGQSGNGVVLVSSGGVITSGAQQGNTAAAVGGTSPTQSGGGRTVIVGGGGLQMGTVHGGPQAVGGNGYSQPTVNQPIQQGATQQGGVSMEAAQQLNNVSASLLDTYKKMADEAESVTIGNDGFADNVRLLNENIKRLNHVFESQLSSVDGQASISKYINDSLESIKSIYDGAIADSYAFKRETERMTKQIEALNRVYARLLQAMTSNNSNPIY